MPTKAKPSEEKGRRPEINSTTSFYGILHHGPWPSHVAQISMDIVRFSWFPMVFKGFPGRGHQSCATQPAFPRVSIAFDGFLYFSKVVYRGLAPGFLVGFLRFSDGFGAGGDARSLRPPWHLAPGIRPGPARQRTRTSHSKTTMVPKPIGLTPKPNTKETNWSPSGPRSFLMPGN